MVFPDVDATFNIRDLVNWIKERAVGMYAWLKGVINMYKWARWILKNGRAVCGTLLFSAMLLHILVDINWTMLLHILDNVATYTGG